MARNIEIKISRHEAVVIVTALGSLKNRTAQKARWQTTKRMRTLRQRLAAAITIDDEVEQRQVRVAMENSERARSRFASRAAGIGGLQEYVRQQAGIGKDEKIDYAEVLNDQTDEQDESGTV